MVCGRGGLSRHVQKGPSCQSLPRGDRGTVECWEEQTPHQFDPNEGKYSLFLLENTLSLFILLCSPCCCIFVVEAKLARGTASSCLGDAILGEILLMWVVATSKPCRKALEISINYAVLIGIY